MGVTCGGACLMGSETMEQQQRPGPVYDPAFLHPEEEESEGKGYGRLLLVVGVGVLLGAPLMFWYWRRRQRRKTFVQSALETGRSAFQTGKSKAEAAREKLPSAVHSVRRAGRRRLHLPSIRR